MGSSPRLSGHNVGLAGAHQGLRVADGQGHEPGRTHVVPRDHQVLAVIGFAAHDYVHMGVLSIPVTQSCYTRI
jgi:hypothetical protein